MVYQSALAIGLVLSSKPTKQTNRRNPMELNDHIAFEDLMIEQEIETAGLTDLVEAKVIPTEELDRILNELGV